MTENPKLTLETGLESADRPSKIAKTEDFSDEEEEQKPAIHDPSMSQNPRIQRYLVAVEYIGTRFFGSQKQPNCRTVVGALEDAFHKFIGQPVSISLSSRTDAGVHALSNVCHVDIERISKRKPGEVLPPHEPAVVRRAVNHFLQKNEGDISVVDVRCVPSDFHARYKAQEHTSIACCLGRSLCQPLRKIEHGMYQRNLIFQLCKRHAGFLLDTMILVPSGLLVVRKQNEVSDDPHGYCCKFETGCHISVPSIEKASSKEILGFGKRRSHRCLVITARACSFLYHQVRLLVGVLKAVGTGSLTISDVERILNAKDVTAASPMAPACGLYLGEVKYDLP